MSDIRTGRVEYGQLGFVQFYTGKLLTHPTFPLPTDQPFEQLIERQTITNSQFT